VGAILAAAGLVFEYYLGRKSTELIHFPKRLTGIRWGASAFEGKYGPVVRGCFVGGGRPSRRPSG